MVSIIVCSKKLTELLRRWFFLCLMLPALAWAAEIEIGNQQLSASDEGYVLSADFGFELNSRLEEAVAKGVVLHFVVDFELLRGRWYWLDEKLLTRSQVYRLSYHALTRQYRLSTGGLHQSFSSLSEALRVLTRLRNWLVIERPDSRLLKVGDLYTAELRLRLDVTQLPRPFQISALGNKEWSLNSDWKLWTLNLPPLPPVDAK